VKFGSFGHNSLESCAYLSFLYPCVIVPMKVMGNCPSPYIILLQTCNLGSEVFTWSILSWIMHKNSSFDHTNYVFQVWYKFIHDYWCKICFFSFPSYSITSLLFLPTFVITNNAFSKDRPSLSHIDILMVSFPQPTHGKLRNTTND